MDRIERLVDLQAAALAKVAIDIDNLANTELKISEHESNGYKAIRHVARCAAFIEAKQVITNAIIEVTREAAK